MTLVAPYAEALEHTARMRPTQAALTQLSAAWPVRRVPVGEDARYESVIRDVWGHEDVIIVEHDVVPTAAMIAALAACAWPWCAQAYTLHPNPSHAALIPQLDAIGPLWRSTGPGRRLLALQAPVWPHRNGPDDDPNFCGHGDRWADRVGLGLTKFTAAACRAIPPDWPSGSWRDLDTRLSHWLASAGVRWHLHEPEAAHHHFCVCHPEETDAWLGDPS